mmetsp:Transcript_93616/g.243799  ORF Transcript_93616/g.243799 Transcript_93616/m.243799 type:complete len:254 (-) Transcript_93616:62-823(-)
MVRADPEVHRYHHRRPHDHELRRTQVQPLGLHAAAVSAAVRRSEAQSPRAEAEVPGLQAEPAELDAGVRAHGGSDTICMCSALRPVSLRRGEDRCHRRGSVRRQRPGGLSPEHRHIPCYPACIWPYVRTRWCHQGHIDHPGRFFFPGARNIEAAGGRLCHRLGGPSGVRRRQQIPGVLRAWRGVEADPTRAGVGGTAAAGEARAPARGRGRRGGPGGREAAGLPGQGPAPRGVRAPPPAGVRGPPRGGRSISL